MKEKKKTMQYIMQHEKVLFSSDDGVSIPVIWNNITGKNFQEDGIDGTSGKIQYHNYLEMMKQTAGLPDGYVQYFKAPGKMVAEFCVPSSTNLDTAKLELVNQGNTIHFAGATKFSDIFVPDSNGVHGYGLPGKFNLTKDAQISASGWHCAQWGHSYHFQMFNRDNGFTQIFIKADQIIASSTFALIETSSIPSEKKDEQLTTKVVLAKCTINKDFVVKLPDIQLDRKIYEEVKSILTTNGGSWKGGKTQGFKFNFNPTELITRLQKGEDVNNKKTFQFFGTPEGLVDSMIEKACLQDSDEALEPSAGQGAIANKILPLCKKVDICEFMPENREILERNGYRILQNDFLDLDLKFKYDKIIANPPFTKNQDIIHVRKMYDHLKKGGRLVSIMSTTWISGSQKKQKEFQTWLDSVQGEVEKIAGGTFKESGTNIPTVMIVINKK